MAQGPSLIFDKSSLESLNLQHRQLITPSLAFLGHEILP